MPFTPFHMGAALIFKPVLDRNFSVIAFGLAQVAMDIEPGIRMLLGAAVLHGPSHTVLGALVVACLVMLVAPRVCGLLVERWNKEVAHYGGSEWLYAKPPAQRAVMLGAFFGTLSHVALDSLIHVDILPLLPFSRTNPLLGLLSHDAVYQACAVAGVLGAAAWLLVKWITRSIRVNDSPVQFSANGPLRIWAVWIHDLRFTWFWSLVLSVVPALLFGSGIASIGVLAVAIGIGLFAIAMSRPFTRRWPIECLRRLAATVSLPALSLVYVFEADAWIPANATPIVLAIETHYRETGRYPDSIDEIVPVYLDAIPILKASVVQPPVRYRLLGGQPRLTIPSARGDAFAAYEYNFEAKVWIHHE